MSVEIVPRWEWRTFGHDFGAAEEVLGALEIERFEESSDLYLLFRDSDATVKLRHGLLDVKGLLTVDDDGLEQWVPVAKHAFPVSRDERRCRARPVARGRGPAARPRGPTPPRSCSTRSCGRSTRCVP